MARRVATLFSGPKKATYADVDYQGLSNQDSEQIMMLPRDSSGDESIEGDQSQESRKRPGFTPVILPLRRIFTWNLMLTITSQAILEGHIGAYNTLWPSFLSAPVVREEEPRTLWSFSGGLGMSIRDVARSLIILGIVGLPLQIFGYPRAQQKFGTLGLLRFFLLGFPLAYMITPLLAVLPSDSPPPAPRHGALVWCMIVIVQALVVLSGTFVIPAQLTLTNKYVLFGSISASASDRPFEVHPHIPQHWAAHIA